MDEATKAIANSLKSKVSYLPERTEKLLERKFRELKNFNNRNFKKYFGEIRGWHVVVEKLTPEDEKQHRVMTLLLLDKENYSE